MESQDVVCFLGSRCSGITFSATSIGECCTRNTPQDDVGLFYTIAQVVGCSECEQGKLGADAVSLLLCFVSLKLFRLQIYFLHSLMLSTFSLPPAYFIMINQYLLNSIIV